MHNQRIQRHTHTDCTAAADTACHVNGGHIISGSNDNILLTDAGSEVLVYITLTIGSGI